jgi:hypothetical protein
MSFPMRELDLQIAKEHTRVLHDVFTWEADALGVEIFDYESHKVIYR